MSPGLDAADAGRLEECVASGGVAVFPTDTVYGVCCDADDERAAERMYRLKGRPATRPAAVMFFSIEPALATLGELQDTERAALGVLLPGPVTVLLASWQLARLAPEVEATTGKRQAFCAARLGIKSSSPAKESAVSELSPDYFNRPLAEVDPEIAEVLRGELEREQRTLEMIASENFVPRAVLECQGSVLTNKYAEGYPGRRYYGGCEWVDVSEQLAIDRAKALFGAEHANVQPHSGPQANAAAYHALLQPGDR